MKYKQYTIQIWDFCFNNDGKYKCKLLYDRYLFDENT